MHVLRLLNGLQEPEKKLIKKKNREVHHTRTKQDDEVNLNMFFPSLRSTPLLLKKSATSESRPEGTFVLIVFLMKLAFSFMMPGKIGTGGESAASSDSLKINSRTIIQVHIVLLEGSCTIR